MKKYSAETTVGIFVVLGLLCMGYMAVKLGKVSIFGDEVATYFARFSSVSGLREGSPVEVMGIRVGTVDRLTIDADKQMALAKLKVKKDLKVYDDAQASIKTTGLIGDKLVKLDPGGSGETLKSGGTIAETASPLDIEDLIGKYAFGDVKKGGKDEKKEEK